MFVIAFVDVSAQNHNDSLTMMPWKQRTVHSFDGNGLILAKHQRTLFSKSVEPTHLPTSAKNAEGDFDQFFNLVFV